MADSGDPPPMACGESPESAMGVRSAELSACLKSFLSVCLKPLIVLPWPQLRKLPVHPAVYVVAHHDTHCEFTGGPSAEKRQKQSIPGLNGFELDDDTPLDVIMGPCQFPEMLAPYRNVGGRHTTFLTAFSSNAHATGRDLSYYKPLKLVCDYREAWDRAIFYYDDEEERLWQ
jgi:hypothetical protein